MYICIYIYIIIRKIISNTKQALLVIKMKNSLNQIHPCLKKKNGSITLYVNYSTNEHTILSSQVYSSVSWIQCKTHHRECTRAFINSFCHTQRCAENELLMDFYQKCAVSITYSLLTLQNIMKVCMTVTILTEVKRK